MANSIRDVASRAQVAVGTVSNFLNRPDRVAEATRKKIESAIADLNFVPNASARHLRSGSSRTIGLLVPDITNPFLRKSHVGLEIPRVKMITPYFCATAMKIRKRKSAI